MWRNFYDEFNKIDAEIAAMDRLYGKYGEPYLLSKLPWPEYIERRLATLQKIMSRVRPGFWALAQANQGLWDIGPQDMVNATQYRRLMEAQGFTTTCFTGAGPSTPYDDGSASQWQATPINICGVSGQVPNLSVPDGSVGGYPGWYNIPAAARWVGSGMAWDLGTGWRYRVDQQFTRPAGQGAKQISRRAYARPTVGISPALSPSRLPIMGFAPKPAPLPLSMLKFRRGVAKVLDPVYHSTGEEPSTQPLTWYDFRRPNVTEIIVEAPRPGKPPVVRPPKPGVHVRRPPRREREKKVMGLPKMLEAAIGLITESMDITAVFYKALEPSVKREQPKDLNPWEKFQVVIANLDKVRIPELVIGLINMIAEDAFFGKLGAAQGKANRFLYEHFGINLAGRLPKSYLQPKLPAIREK